MSSDPRHILGKWGEEAALKHLTGLGYVLLARNFRTRSGELDLVAQDKDEVVFVEVRTKQKTDFGHPFETINLQKQQQVIRVARQFLARGPLPADLAVRRQELFCRFDVVGVTVGCDGEPVIEHLKNAFST